MKTRGLLKLISIALAALLACTACGLPNDATPTVIANDQIPDSLRPGQIGPGPGTDQVHMIQDGRLVTVSRRIAETPQELIDELLVGTFPEEATAGITTAIFRTTQVADIQYNEPFRLLTIRLAPGSVSPDNSEQRFAFAQIVYTMTSLPEVDAVQFELSDPSDPSGEPIKLPVQTDTGSSLPGERVTRESFASLDPSAPIASPGFDIPTAVPPDAEANFALAVWMLDSNNKLVEVQRMIPRSAESLLRSLFNGPSAAEINAGIRTALPLDALFTSVRTQEFEVGLDPISRNVAVVDLADGSLPTDDATGERFLAVAQIVYTLTQLAEVDLVVISLNGVWQTMPREGDRNAIVMQGDALARDNYASATGDFATGSGFEIGPAAAPTATPTPTPTPEP